MLLHVVLHHLITIPIGNLYSSVDLNCRVSFQTTRSISTLRPHATAQSQSCKNSMSNFFSSQMHVLWTPAEPALSTVSATHSFSAMNQGFANSGSRPKLGPRDLPIWVAKLRFSFDRTSANRFVCKVSCNFVQENCYCQSQSWNLYLITRNYSQTEVLTKCLGRENL